MSASKQGKTIGVFETDLMIGRFGESWKSALDEKNFESIDISASIEYIMGPKEENEILWMKTACMTSVDIFDKHIKKIIWENFGADEVRCPCN